jgi:hypothetical protein
MMKNILILVIFVFAGCGKKDAEIQPPQAMSANDLSFLLPLNSFDQNKPKQKVTIADTSFDILTQSNFQSILQAAQNNKVFLNNQISNPNNWYLVSFRYSPCIHFSGTANPCKEQIRFIFQPHEGEGSTRYLDYAIHVTYELSSGIEPVRSEMMEAMLALRALSGSKTANRPLQVHPVLNDENLSKNYFDFLKLAIFGRFIKGKSPFATTFMGLGRDQQGQMNRGEWNFLFGKMNSSGQWVHSELPTGGGHGVVTMGFNQGNLSTNLANDPSVKFNLFSSGITPSLTSLNIFNAVATNEHNVDCASCHVSDNRSFLKNSNVNASEINNFSNNFFDQVKNANRMSEVMVDNRFRGARAVPNEVVTRIFGYMNSAPIISQRVVNDNALAVESVNAVLGALEPVQCSDEVSRKKVVDCLLLGQDQMTVSACIAINCAQSK